mmetsp:Transcript_11737/g.26774  ORF Transcript_11737/g.26774 Transcript_11737/m.26774 type:complete len:217 (-) Transcript_11737:405-1055(-)
MARGQKTGSTVASKRSGHRCSRALRGHGTPKWSHWWRQFGFLFSMKASKPSRLSSRPQVAWKRPRSSLRPSARGVSSAAFTHSLASAATGADIEAIFSAVLMASSRTVPLGKTCATRPAFSASAAVSMSPVRISCIALDLPTARMSLCVPPTPGMVPSLISGWPNLASSEARMMSHDMASSQPPPNAKPLTAAMTGFRMAETPDQCASMFPLLVSA